jgi:hypothetical protein
MTVISWNMLFALLMLKTSYPRWGIAAAISEYTFVRLVLVSHMLERSLGI